MADREIIREERRGAGAGTTLLSWLAILLSIAALALAWTAYNRTGTDLESKIQQRVNEATERVDQNTQLENEPGGNNNSGDTNNNTNIPGDTPTNN